MSEIKERIKILENQERTLIFESFGQEDAAEIGWRLFGKAKAKNQRIAVHISMNRRDMFHLSMDGCTPDNDIWLRKKENMVYRFYKSSLNTVTFCELMGTNVFDFYGLDADSYAEAGGGFPIILKGTGCVGAICCGGMTPQQDHQIIVDILTEYLKK